MAQSQQQQYPMPQSQIPFSPALTSPSSGAQQQFNPNNPNKRQRMSPPAAQGSANFPSPYGMSTSASAPQSASSSPHFPHVTLPQQAYNNSPYANGSHPPTPTSSHPPSQSNHFNPPQHSPLNFPGQSQAGHQPNYFNPMMNAPQGAGTMGPPSKPPEKPKEDGVDPMDVLGGTGIDLREEELYTFQINNSSFNSQQSGSQSGTISSGNSFTQFPPGKESSFYGAGPANAHPQATNTKSQEEYHRKVVEKTWADAAHDLAVSRQRELGNPFLVVANVHKKMDQITREHGLVLNTEGPNKGMGTMKLPVAFASPTVNIQTAVGPNGAITLTSGNFVPPDSLQVDQLALLSIATKHRLRELLEDAAKLAKGRQTGSHGALPEEWADVAAPSQTESGSLVTEGAPRSGWESAVSPHSNPLKHSLSAANRIPTPISEGGKTPNEPLKLENEMVRALRKAAQRERDLEEMRLKKRLARNSGDTPSRQGSVIPGTPGSVAPESIEKAPTKKELKKKAEAKTNEAASHAAANATTNQFLMGGGSMFGKKKKYSWMTGGAGGSGSGTNTPGRIMTQGLSGTLAGAAVSVAPERLTVDGARRLGTWREDKEKGRGIQIRDWVAVLENDGREKKALQKAYANLDSSEPK